MALHVKSTHSDEESFSCDLRHTFDVGCAGYLGIIFLIVIFIFLISGAISGKTEGSFDMIWYILQIGIIFAIPISVTFQDKGRFIKIDKVNKKIIIYKINFRNGKVLIMCEPLDSVKNFGWDDEKIKDGSEMGTSVICFKSDYKIHIFTPLYKIEMNHLINSMNRCLEQTRKEGKANDR